MNHVEEVIWCIKDSRTETEQVVIGKSLRNNKKQLGDKHVIERVSVLLHIL